MASPAFLQRLLPRPARPGLTWQAARVGRSPLQMAGWAMAIVGLCLLVGLLAVLVGNFSAVRPVFALALPLVITIVFAFILNPKALVLAIILLRAGTNQVFEGSQLAGIGGLGGAVNLAVILLAVAMVAREPGRIPRAAWWAWLPFLAMQFIGLGYSPDPGPALRLALGQLSTAAMFYLAFYLVDDLKSLDKLLRLMVWASIPVAVISVIAIATGTTAGALDDPLASSAGRYAGPFPHPNLLAFYLVLMIGVVLYLWKSARSTAGWAGRLAYAGYILLLLVLLAATKTRSAWIAMFVLFALYGLFVERRYLVYLLIAPALAMLVPELRERVLALGEGNTVVQYARLNSFAWRKLLWESAFAWMGKSRLMAGYGSGAFPFHSTTFFPFAGGINWGAHSVVVQLLFDLGLCGLLSYCWLFGSVLRNMMPIRRSDKTLGVLAIAMLVMYFVVSTSDNMLAYLVFNWYFWVFIGAVWALTRQVQAPPPGSTRATAARAG